MSPCSSAGWDGDVGSAAADGERPPLPRVQPFSARAEQAPFQPRQRAAEPQPLFFSLCCPTLCTGFGCFQGRQAQGDGLRGEAAGTPPIAPFPTPQHPRLYLTPGALPGSSQLENREKIIFKMNLMYFQTSLLEFLSLFCASSVFSPARALQAAPWLHPRAALFHPPSPSPSFGMSLASLRGSRKPQMGMFGLEQLGPFWESEEKQKVAWAGGGQPAPSGNHAGFRAGTSLCLSQHPPKPSMSSFTGWHKASCLSPRS